MPTFYLGSKFENITRLFLDSTLECLHTNPDQVSSIINMKCNINLSLSISNTGIKTNVYKFEIELNI